MVAVNTMRIGDSEFAIQAASFRYITQSWSGPGWDFRFAGPCTHDPRECFPYGARLLTEAGPLPLARSADYTGMELHVPEPFDDASGEPFFGLNVAEEHEVSQLHLRFAERDGPRYRIEIVAQVAATVFGVPARLELNAWADEQADHAYPA